MKDFGELLKPDFWSYSCKKWLTRSYFCTGSKNAYLPTATTSHKPIDEKMIRETVRLHS